mmetsp:Transcript_30157/g.95110  ORF Transcript_30157/g.95110 Transcript_30157/m.95110 type:complete len:207 (-) Transcript_30157:563-1183(-)
MLPGLPDPSAVAAPGLRRCARAARSGRAAAAPGRGGGSQGCCSFEPGGGKRVPGSDGSSPGRPENCGGRTAAAAGGVGGGQGCRDFEPGGGHRLPSCPGCGAFGPEGCGGTCSACRKGRQGSSRKGLRSPAEGCGQSKLVFCIGVLAPECRRHSIKQFCWRPMAHPGVLEPGAAGHLRGRLRAGWAVGCPEGSRLWAARAGTWQKG